MSHPLWDLNISMRTFKRVLRHPEDERFSLFFARLLSRVPFRTVFRDYITPHEFTAHYPKVRRLLSADLLGQGREPFWTWLYRRLTR